MSLRHPVQVLTIRMGCIYVCVVICMYTLWSLNCVFTLSRGTSFDVAGGAAEVGFTATVTACEHTNES